MSGRSHFKQIQGPIDRSSTLYQSLQDQIREQTGVECTIVVTPNQISIRASYPDFIIAKNAIKERAKGIPIVRDFLPLQSTGESQ